MPRRNAFNCPTKPDATEKSGTGTELLSNLWKFSYFIEIIISDSFPSQVLNCYEHAALGKPPPPLGSVPSVGR